jgi:hypothetical protein
MVVRFLVLMGGEDRITGWAGFTGEVFLYLSLFPVDPAGPVILSNWESA